MKEIFYKNADSYLIKTKQINNNNDDFIHLNFHLNKNSDKNSGEKWLKNFTENMVKNFSCKNRENIKNHTNNHNIRFLIELEDYIKKYIIDFDYSCKVVGNQNSNTSLNATNNLINVEQQSNLDKSYERIEKILDNVLDKFLNIKYENGEFIKNIETIDSTLKEQIDQYKEIYITLNNNIFESLGDELNNYNYDIGNNQNKNRNKNLIDLDFKNNNYIYYKKNNEDDIKLINIKEQKYKDILINGGLTVGNSNNIVNKLLTKYPNSSYNIIKCALLSIRNRFQLINKNLKANIFVFESYITRGTLFYYKTILDAIKTKIKDKNDDNSYIYLPILFSVFFYQTLFEKLYNKITDEQVINFKLLDDHMFSNDTIQKTNTLNSFASLFYIEIKPFLDQYKAADSEQKVKLFCNINDYYDAIKDYNTNTDNYNINDIVKENIKNLIGKNYKQNGNGNGNNNNREVDKRVFTIKNKKSNSKYDILQINTNTNLINNTKLDNCEPFKLNFNKIFDGTNPQVMAPYMAASNVINNYEGLMLFTFGYSGVGKSFTVFGDKEKKGVLPSIINSIQNVDSVDVRIYEIYGMGLNISNENFNDNKYFKYISYELNIVDENNININEENITITDNLEIVLSKKLDTKKLKKFLDNLDNINNKIEEIRGKINNNIKYSTGQINDNGINIKTIKKTKNNPDSSRSILCYELIIDKDGQKIPFIICDLPGKEKIIDSFGKEGEGLLKINNKNEINDNFLNDHFDNILKKLDEQLKPDKIKKVFKEIDDEINETIDSDNITITYELLENIKRFSGNFKTIFDKESFKDNEYSIKLSDIKIESNDSDNVVRIKNLIANIPDLLTFNQKKFGIHFSNLPNSENRIFTIINKKIYLNNSKLYIGFNKKYHDKIKITKEKNNSNGINFTFNDSKIISEIVENIKNVNPIVKTTRNNTQKNELFKNINNGIPEKNNNEIINFFISDNNLIELEKIANKKLNKKRLIKAMNNAISYKQNNETKITPHPVLKLTQILDEINDKEYIKEDSDNYKNNAEKCFKYTKAAEGIFINENINGIIQLLSDKKGLSNINKNQGNYYKEENMYYNEKNNTNNYFNSTIIYEKLYDIYEKKTNNASNGDKLRKIDNMYAFFVVANISSNERIKQKLICNATKTKQGYKTEQVLGWVCDQEEVDKKNKEKEEKEEKKKKEKIEQIKDIIRLIINDSPRAFELLINRDPTKMEFFIKNIKNKTESLKIKINIDEKKAETKKLLMNMSEIFNDKNSLEEKSKEEYIEKLTNILYDEYMVKDNTNTTDKKISSSNSNNSNNNNFERELYIKEMCKTQIALFRELEDKINQINKSEE